MSYIKMIIGCLFLVDFKIHGVDILFDTVGYALFYSGLNQLKAGYPAFKKASYFALIAAILSAFNTYAQVLIMVNEDYMSRLAMGYSAFNVSLVSFLALGMIIMMTHGIEEESLDSGYEDLSKKSRRCRYLYIASAVIGLLMSGLILYNTLVRWSFITGIVFLLVIALIILGLIVTFNLIGLLHQANLKIGR